MNRAMGISLVVVSAAGFGTLALFGVFAREDGMDVFTILFLRFSLAAALMIVPLAIRRERWPARGTLVRLIGMGAIGYIGQSFAYLTALQYASPGLVALLLYLYPLIVTVLAAVVLHEAITRVKALALGLAVLGLALTVGPEGGQLAGILLAIGAAAIYSVYILVGTQVLKQVSASLSSAVIFASAGLSAGGLMLVNGPHWPESTTGWWAIAGIVVVATVLPVITFLAGLERIGPTQAAMLSVLEPVVTVLLSAWWLGVTLSPVSLVGGGLILAAVLVLTRGERSAPVSHADPTQREGQQPTP